MDSPPDGIPHNFPIGLIHRITQFGMMALAIGVMTRNGNNAGITESKHKSIPSRIPLAAVLQSNIKTERIAIYNSGFNRFMLSPDERICLSRLLFAFVS